jgi:hypothetical protein
MANAAGTDPREPAPSQERGRRTGANPPPTGPREADSVVGHLGTPAGPVPLMAMEFSWPDYVGALACVWTSAACTTRSLPACMPWVRPPRIPRC